VLKVAVVAAAAELLCLAGKSVGGLMLLDSNDPDRHLKAQGRRFARSFFGGGIGGVGD
jgi:hypothetical protein